MSMMQMLLGASGAADIDVADVFDVKLFTANGTTGQTLTTGIDLATEGGMVWHKDRAATYQHVMWDSARGNGEYFVCPSNASSKTNLPDSCSFNTDGHTLDAALGNEGSNATVAWTFRKAKKFFDVVAYNGGSSSQAHNLGCVPGMIIVKRRDSTDNWIVYHKDLDSDGYLVFDNKFNQGTNSAYFTTTAPTDSVFYLGSDSAVNNGSGTYVAYLFAADQANIKCGSYTGAGSSHKEVDVGFDPQYVLIKKFNKSGGDVERHWLIGDTTRGISNTPAQGVTSTSDYGKRLQVSQTDAEAHHDSVWYPVTDGFGIWANTGDASNGSGDTYIYMAIKKEG